MMIDLNKVRENLDEYKRVCKLKSKIVDVDLVLELDGKRKSMQAEIDNLKFQQKELAAKQDYEWAKSLKSKIQSKEEEYKSNIEKLDELLLTMPQFMSPDVPEWVSEEDNVEIKKVWEIPKFSFDAKDHIELMKKYDMIDQERAVKLSWARSYFLKWDWALLENALMQYSLDLMVKKWFTPFIVPNIVSTQCLTGTWYFPGGEDDAYNMEKDDKWLIGTGEIPLTSYHSEEILNHDELPKTYVALSSCYRREAGTYGKDTAWLYRVHQFSKVEQVIILPEDIALSDQWHKKILENAEEVLQNIWVPYRLLQLCSWDLALWKYNSHDLECWMPSRNSYWETHSATSFLDFQARRLNIRYRDQDWTIKYCYTLNNTVIASPRILIPIIENNQTEDGKIKIPEVLRKYMGGREYIQ
jgi:seryl-tRNA synthetase